jgi:abequosyltransferase
MTISFCIPTFNRRDYLKETIESILNDVELYKGKSSSIEICISDNNSDDGTEEMVQGLIECSPIKIIYSKNPYNIGFDKNILKVVSLSNSEFCWLFGSDDILIENSITKAINAMKYSKAELFIAARVECDLNLNSVRTNPITDSTKTKFRANDGKDLYAYFDACNGLLGGFSFISSLIFKKENWDKQKFNENFDGLVYSHVYMILSILKNQNITFQIIPCPLIKCRLNDDIVKNAGFAKRILLDIDGYAKFAKEFFSDNSVVYHAFVKMVRKEHKLASIIFLRGSLDNRTWRNDVLPKLRDLHYHTFFLMMITKSKQITFMFRIVFFLGRKLGLKT